LVSVTTDPTHTADGPPIVPGAALTVTILVAAQPPAVYEIIAVPAVTPVTMLPLIAAIDDSEELHVPPGVASLIAEVDPAQILVLPTMADGDGLTVTFFVCIQPLPSE